MFDQYPLVAVPLRNGMIAGILGMIMLLGLYYLGRHPFLVPVFFDFRIILFGVMLFYTLKEFREYYQNGMLLFWQGMVMSFVFAMVFALVASLLVWAFASWKPEFVREFVTLYRQQVTAAPPPQVIDKMGKEAFEKSLTALDATSAGDVAWLYWKQSVILSFFVSIILSVILRRQPKP
jgi:hypothetical protein